MNVTQKLIRKHLPGQGPLQPGEDISIGIDQTLTQDATGTLVMLELEAMGLDRVRTELSAQYVDHNLLQADSRNAEDHAFLLSACRRFGLWYSRPGNGVSHVVHMQRFGKPGKTLLGSDSHTCAAGSLGMLAIGVGGLDVATAMAGRPFTLKMPEVWGVELVGRLSPWVSAKDVILEMLRRHGVRGGRGRILEYYGPGLETLGAMERHVIANMGAELGAVTSVFPSDGRTRSYLKGQGREKDWEELSADPGSGYDVHEKIDLTHLEPLIARPSSPGNVVPVREAAGEPIHQAYIGSSANPGYRDLAVPARMVAGRQVHQRVSFDINPASRQDLQRLILDGHLADLVRAGARIHQVGCNGCIGMGQAPAAGKNSLRTTPRNFPGRSGTPEDRIFLCSPETAAASALTGVITDPRESRVSYPRYEDGGEVNTEMLLGPPPRTEAASIELEKGPNIGRIPDLDEVPDRLTVPILLQVGDDISTDEILPAGSRVLPFRSNIAKISEFVFEGVDPGYARRAAASREDEGHAILAGHNYGQGSSREHAALAARYLGLRLVVAKSIARIHRQNLINFGVLPLILANEEDYDRLDVQDVVEIEGIHRGLEKGGSLSITTKSGSVEAMLPDAARDRKILRAGGLLRQLAASLDEAAS